MKINRMKTFYSKTHEEIIMTLLFSYDANFHVPHTYQWFIINPIWTGGWEREG